MGIYIHGMEMPKAGDCFIIYPDGEVWNGGKRIGKVGTAIELPPHGRLGDLGELEFAFNESAEGLHGTPKWAEIYLECAKAVREAETIIQADPEKEDT